MHNHKLESSGRRRHEETTVGHTRGEGNERDRGIKKREEEGNIVT